MSLNFTYAGIIFHVNYDPNDCTGLGSISEIVNNNDYVLDKFINQKNKNFIDIGANLGIATIIMAKLNPESTVYAFEPFKKAYDLLIKNIELNSLVNVKPFNLAVSNKETKKLKLSILDGMSGANSTYADHDLFKIACGSEPVHDDIVDCISMDDILVSNKIDEVYLIKIDCEGAEYDIIYDSNIFKNKIIKNIVGEFHILIYGKEKRDAQTLINYCHEYIEGIIKISTLVQS